MLRLFNLFFSQAGCVGRATWWWTQLFTLVLAGVLLLCAKFTDERIKHYSSVEWTHKDAYLQSLPVFERNKAKRDTISEDGILLAAQVSAVFLLIWAHICIEVKRWHDLGLSGYWVWIRLVPALATAFLGPIVGGIAGLAVPLGTLYFLGFRPGIYDDDDEMRHPTPSSSDFAKNLLGVILLVALVLYGVRNCSGPHETTFDSAPDSSGSDDGNQFFSR